MEGALVMVVGVLVLLVVGAICGIVALTQFGGQAKKIRRLDRQARRIAGELRRLSEAIEGTGEPAAKEPAPEPSEQRPPEEPAPAETEFA
ncbi:MAG: hypothetical protein ACOC8E_02220, partial [Planctomycetota bacterium]